MTTIMYRFVFLLCAGLFASTAWAVDTDGDGVDDSLMRFRIIQRRLRIRIGMVKPDSINVSKLPVILNGFSISSPWTQTGSGLGSWTLVSSGVVRGSGGGMFGGTGKKLQVTITVPAAGATISYFASDAAAWVDIHQVWEGHSRCGPQLQYQPQDTCSRYANIIVGRGNVLHRWNLFKCNRP